MTRWKGPVQVSVPALDFWTHFVNVLKSSCAFSIFQQMLWLLCEISWLPSLSLTGSIKLSCAPLFLRRLPHLFISSHPLVQSLSRSWKRVALWRGALFGHTVFQSCKRTAQQRGISDSWGLRIAGLDFSRKPHSVMSPEVRPLYVRKYHRGCIDPAKTRNKTPHPAAASQLT